MTETPVDPQIYDTSAVDFIADDDDAIFASSGSRRNNRNGGRNNNQQPKPNNTPASPSAPDNTSGTQSKPENTAANEDEDDENGNGTPETTPSNPNPEQVNKPAEGEQTTEKKKDERLRTVSEINKELQDREKARLETMYGKGFTGTFRKWFADHKGASIATKILLGAGITALSASALMAGPFALIAAPILFSQGIRIGANGVVEAGQAALDALKGKLGQEHELRGRMEIAKRNYQAGLEQLGMLEKDRDQMDPAEYQRQASEIIKVIADQEKTVAEGESTLFKSENARKVFRGKASTVITIAVSLLSGVPMGIQDFDKGVVAATHLREPSHQMMWSLLRHGSKGWSWNNFDFLYGAADTIHGATINQYSGVLNQLLHTNGLAHQVGARLLPGYIGLGGALASFLLFKGKPRTVPAYSDPSFLPSKPTETTTSTTSEATGKTEKKADANTETDNKDKTAETPPPSGGDGSGTETETPKEKTTNELLKENQEKVEKLRNELGEINGKIRNVNREIGELEKQPDGEERNKAIAEKADERKRLEEQRDKIEAELYEIREIVKVIDEIADVDQETEKVKKSIDHLEKHQDSDVNKTRLETFKKRLPVLEQRRTALVEKLKREVAKSHEGEKPLSEEEREKLRLEKVTKNFQELVNNTDFDPEKLKDVKGLKKLFELSKEGPYKRKIVNASYNTAHTTIYKTPATNRERTSALIGNLKTGFVNLIKSINGDEDWYNDIEPPKSSDPTGSLDDPGNSKPETETNLEGGFNVRELTSEESQQIFERLSLRNDLEYNGQKLTPETLINNDLLPKYEIEFAGRRVWSSSKNFEYGSRIAGLAYFDNGDDKNVSVLPYMSSGSQAIMRFYPCFLTEKYDTADGKSAEKIDWFSKGYGEESLALPIELQAALSKANPEVVSIEQKEAELILVGASDKVEAPEGMHPAIAQGLAKERGGIRSGVDKDPGELDGIPPESMRKFNGNPEDIEFANPEDKPVFDKILVTWERQDPIYGKVVYESFASTNGDLNYLFCRDERNRAWIGQIEVTSTPLNKVGLRQQWIDSGVLTTPAYEYAAQLTDQNGNFYGNGTDAKGSYVDSFDKFLSKVPIIQEYLASVAARS